MFENVCKIKFSGAAFISDTVLDFYPKSDERMSIIYGKNGSGKSTIAKAFRKIKGLHEDSIVSAFLLDNQTNIISLNEQELQKIYVFDEDYIQRNVQFKEQGLSTIVMFGQQGDLEKRIVEARKEFDEVNRKRIEQSEVCDKYENEDSTLSPLYFLKQMKAALSGDNHWSGRERKIKGNRQNAAVNDNSCKKIIGSVPTLSESEVISQYTDKFNILQQSRQGNAKITEVVPMNISKLIDESSLKVLLEKKLESPELSEREIFAFSYRIWSFDRDFANFFFRFYY